MKPRIALPRLSRRRRRHVAEDVAPTLEAMAKVLAAGQSLTTACAEVAAGGDDRPFAAIVGEAHRQHLHGASLAESFATVGAARPTTDGMESIMGLAVLELAARHGGAPAMSLERTAAGVRQRRAAIGERRAHSAQARLSALVLTVLPAGFGAWTIINDARARAFLLGAPLGWSCLGAGVALNATGWWWMRRVIGATT